MTSDELARTIVEVEAVDTHTLLPGGELVGKYSIDLESIYFSSSQHELYRQWVTLSSGRATYSIVKEERRREYLYGEIELIVHFLLVNEKSA